MKTFSFVFFFLDLKKRPFLTFLFYPMFLYAPLWKMQKWAIFGGVGCLGVFLSVGGWVDFLRWKRFHWSLILAKNIQINFFNLLPYTLPTPTQIKRESYYSPINIQQHFLYLKFLDTTNNPFTLIHILKSSTYIISKLTTP